MTQPAVNVYLWLSLLVMRPAAAFVCTHFERGVARREYRLDATSWDVSMLDSMEHLSEHPIATSIHISASLDSDFVMRPDTTPLMTAVVALVLLVAAQSFINQMLDGDQGLGAFLKDGSGYNKSGFQSLKQKKTETSKDPLPWLKLPQLDFVEVAGQEKSTLPKMKQVIIVEEENSVSDSVYQELERLRLALNRELQEENISEAKRIRDQLEKLMKDNGIEYKTTEEDAFQ
jgi:hypothetical protein